MFFPVFMNVLRGLTQVQGTQLELMRSYAAPEWAVSRKVRVPNSTGLRPAKRISREYAAT